MASSRTKRATVVKVSNEDSLRAELLIAEAELEDPKINPQRRRSVQKTRDELKAYLEASQGTEQHNSESSGSSDDDSEAPKSKGKRGKRKRSPSVSSSSCSSEPPRKPKKRKGSSSGLSSDSSDSDSDSDADFRAPKSGKGRKSSKSGKGRKSSKSGKGRGSKSGKRRKSSKSSKERSGSKGGRPALFVDPKVHAEFIALIKELKPQGAGGAVYDRGEDDSEAKGDWWGIAHEMRTKFPLLPRSRFTGQKCYLAHMKLASGSPRERDGSTAEQLKYKAIMAHREAEKLLQTASGSRDSDGKKFPTPVKGAGAGSTVKLSGQGGHAAKKNGKTARDAAKEADGWGDMLSLITGGGASGIGGGGGDSARETLLLHKEQLSTMREVRERWSNAVKMDPPDDMEKDLCALTASDSLPNDKREVLFKYIPELRALVAELAATRAADRDEANWEGGRDEGEGEGVGEVDEAAEEEAAEEEAAEEGEEDGDEGQGGEWEMSVGAPVPEGVGVEGKKRRR